MTGRPSTLQSMGSQSRIGRLNKNIPALCFRQSPKDQDILKKWGAQLSPIQTSGRLKIFPKGSEKSSRSNVLTV